MGRTTIKTTTYAGSRKYMASRRAVAKAAQVLRKRMGGTIRQPLATYGFRSGYGSRGPELKVNDVNTGVTAIPANITAGNGANLNAIVVGDDYNTRDGRIINMKSLLLRVFVYPSATVASPQGGTVRILVVMDKQSNGAVNAATATILQADAYDSPINLSNRSRFKVIVDKYVPMNACNYAAGALTTGSPGGRVVNIFKKLNFQTVYNTTTGVDTAISSGALTLYIIASTANEFVADIYSRVRFTDG